MPNPAVPGSEVTQWITEWNGGDKSALDRLTPFIYAELRRLAAGLVWSQPPGQTLQATALVHEAYIRLVEDSGLEWRNRAHFFGIAARCMREILVDHARARSASKRGGELCRIPLEEAGAVSAEPDEIIALNEALIELGELDLRKSQIVEFRYFGGLTKDEMSEVLGISPSTIARELRIAQAWLHRKLAS